MRRWGVLVAAVVATAGWMGTSHAAEEPTPTVSLDVDGPVAPGTEVTVTVSGVSAGEYVFVDQCTVGGGVCEPRGGAPVEGDEVRIGIVARRTLLDHRGGADCAVKPCEMRATIYGATSQTASVPIEIDGTVPLVRPTITVSPSTDLVDRQTIAITGSGFEPQSFVRIHQCTLRACSPLVDYGFVEPDGQLGPILSPALRAFDDTDCVTDGPCFVWVLTSGVADLMAGALLTYDPAAPPAPPPEVEAEPTTDLVDLDPVTVTGRNLLPDEWLEVSQCRNGDATSPDRCAYLGGGVVGPDGRIVTEVAVRRRTGGEDCVVVGCHLRVRTRLLDAEIPLAFDPTVPPPPPPSLRVSPDTDLVDHQAVEVSVSGVNQGDYVDAQQCLADGSSCRYRGGGPVDADPFTREVYLERDVFGEDCAVVGCVLAVDIWQGGDSIRLEHPLQFDPSAPRAEPPSMRVLPATGLWDGQRVEARIDGVLPGEYLWVTQCIAGGDPFGDDCGEPSWVDVDGPTVSLRHEVRQELVTPPFATPQTTTDCAVESCVLQLVAGESGLVLASVPLTFSTPPPGRGLYPAQLECVAWPTGGWELGEPPAGVDATELDEAVARMLASDTSAVVVIHGGRLVAEGYDPGVDASTVNFSASVSKTFTGTVIGLLVDEGLLDLDAPAPVPEWSDPADPRHAITLRHLMTMSPGLEWNESYSFTDPNNDILRMLATPDSGSYPANKPLEHEPGTVFEYSTGTTQILARIVSETLDAFGDDLRAELDARLFDVLGQTEELNLDQRGVWRGGAMTNMSTRDFAKLGLLHLRGGVWEDEQLVSRNWIEFMHEPSPAYAGYGGQIWLQGGFVEMVGLFGQKVTVRPDLDLVVASNTPAGGSGAGTREMVALFESAAPARCDDTPLLVDDEATVPAGSTIDIDVLANDPGGDADLRPDTLTLVSGPTLGYAEVAGGLVRYTAPVGVVGTDELRYLVCTTAPYCTEAVATIEIVDWGIELVPESVRVVAGDDFLVGVRAPRAPGDAPRAPVTSVTGPVECAPAGAGTGAAEPGPAEVEALAVGLLWSTDTAWPPGCRVLELTFGDGTTHRVRVEVVAPD